MNASPRVIKEAKRQAEVTSNKMLSLYQRRLATSWSDISSHLALVIPPTFQNQPFNYANLSMFAKFWVTSFEARLSAAVEAPKDEPSIKVDRKVSTFGSITLYPEQQGCFRSIYSALFEDRIATAALQDGKTGSGKTFVGAAVIAQLVQDGFFDAPERRFSIHPIMIFTPKGVVEHWKRILENFGLDSYVSKRKIYVMADSEFNTDYGDMFCSEQEDPITGDVSMIWNPMLCPDFVIPDECHRYARPDSIRTQKLQALIRCARKPRMLFMSATPGEKVNDLQCFVLACRTKFFDFHVTEETFKQFAGLLDATPDRPNREAVKRLRGVLSPYIFSLPYVKPKFKAINVVSLVDFRTPKDEQIYTSAHVRYIESCRKAGKNTSWGKFEVMIALNNFRKTVEPLRAHYLVEQAVANYNSGQYATAIGTAFKETIAEVTFQLVDKYNIPREHISLIWGGKREYRTDDLLSEQELREILDNPDPRKMLSLDKTTRKRIRITLRYLQDQLEHDESPEAQAYRHSRMKDLKLLGKQSDDARQVEIDRFQDGTARIVLFTIASGGIGLSLDRDKELLLPRRGYFTPVYSGKEFQQLLGRLVRRASLSDAYQYICMMRGTVEEEHVVPILDEKLKCIAEITNHSTDFVDLLSQSVSHKHVTTRSEDQAAKDAEKDDTMVSAEEDDEDNDEII